MSRVAIRASAKTKAKVIKSRAHRTRRLPPPPFFLAWPPRSPPRDAGGYLRHRRRAVSSPIAFAQQHQEPPSTISQPHRRENTSIATAPPQISSPSPQQGSQRQPPLPASLRRSHFLPFPVVRSSCAGSGLLLSYRFISLKLPRRRVPASPHCPEAARACVLAQPGLCSDRPVGVSTQQSASLAPSHCQHLTAAVSGPVLPPTYWPAQPAPYCSIVSPGPSCPASSSRALISEVWRHPGVVLLRAECQAGFVSGSQLSFCGPPIDSRRSRSSGVFSSSHLLFRASVLPEIPSTFFVQWEQLLEAKLVTDNLSRQFSFGGCCPSTAVCGAKAEMANPSSTKKEISVYLYIPNIIGYIRVLMNCLAFALCFSNKRIFAILYFVSFVLDAVDGWFARKFNQVSTFGAVLDMVTDRVSTTCLLVILSHFYSPGFIFLALLALDISSHWLQMYSTFLSGKASHKDVKDSSNWLFKAYYGHRLFMGFCCVLYIILFLLAEKQPESVVGVFVDTVKQRSLLSVPFAFALFGWAIKQIVNVIQMKTAADACVFYDTKRGQ
ncbi:hypothetical protein Taro_033164 [Colocasia esculenta]|uniref:CDP-diacylglycerol--inositol 3-phosphatidyltransferase n=1 Tax=Colocasia esculenta TaxID=4460 RepID=A0A843VUK4_COLES|nr:hypothetical protein [Colocasia esculenta]